jgi:hypothetical protein
MSKPFVIPKALIVENALPGCPGLKFFEDSPYRQGDKLVFPNGFTPEDALAIAKRNGMALRFLAKHGLIPMPYEVAKALSNKVRAPAIPVEVMRTVFRGGQPRIPKKPDAPVLERRSSATTIATPKPAAVATVASAARPARAIPRPAPVDVDPVIAPVVPPAPPIVSEVDEHALPTEPAAADKPHDETSTTPNDTATTTETHQ